MRLLLLFPRFSILNKWWYLLAVPRVFTSLISLSVNPSATGNTPVCDWIFDYVDNITVDAIRGNIIHRKHANKHLSSLNSSKICEVWCIRSNAFHRMNSVFLAEFFENSANPHVKNERKKNIWVWWSNIWVWWSNI